MNLSDMIMLGGASLLGLSFAGAPAKAVLAKLKSGLRGSLSGTLVEDEQHDSDRPAPDGFSDHVRLIVEASPDADAATQIEYLSDALSEYQVLKREVGRLSKTKPTGAD